MSKLENTLYKGIITIWFTLMLFTFVMVVFISPFVQYACKNDYDFPNIVLVIVGIISLIIASGLYSFINNKINLMAASYKFLLVTSIILFVIQIIVCYNIYFAVGFDVGGTMIPYARALAEGNYELVNQKVHYFSAYTNNIFLLWLFSLVFKGCFLLGIEATKDIIFVIIIFQCIISSTVGILAFSVTDFLTKSKKYAWLSWIFYAVFIGTCPWMVVTYSDAIGLGIPIAMLCIYYKFNYKSYMMNALLWSLLTFLAFWGYKIKPQIFIMYIAIVLIEIIHCFTNHPSYSKDDIYRKLLSFIAVCFMLIISQEMYSFIVSNTGLKINKDEGFGITHYIMMGLNDENDGVYWADDVAYSAGFSTRNSRVEGNLDKIKERLKEERIPGFIQLMARKSMVNYGDGTFAWGMEGEFYSEVYEEKNDTISPFLRSVYYNNGEYNHYYASLMQMIWLMILVGCLANTSILLIQKVNKNEAMITLALLGLTMFELLCEARARYLYTYSPLYIVIAVCGLQKIRELLKKKVNG